MIMYDTFIRLSSLSIMIWSILIKLVYFQKKTSQGVQILCDSFLITNYNNLWNPITREYSSNKTKFMLASSQLIDSIN